MSLTPLTDSTTPFSNMTTGKHILSPIDNSSLEFEPDSPLGDVDLSPVSTDSSVVSTASIKPRPSVLTLSIVNADSPKLIVKPKWSFKRVHKGAILPSRSTEYAAGYDLYAPQGEVVPALGKAIIPIGWKLRLPPGKYGRIAPRSGLAWKNYIGVGAGVIDEDYSDEVGVILFNHSTVDFEYKAGDRIAQMIIETCHTQYEPTEVDVLPTIESSRTGGYGSTGT
jgi:dUTP pyrophosphatase